MTEMSGLSQNGTFNGLLPRSPAFARTSRYGRYSFFRGPMGGPLGPPPPRTMSIIPARTASIMSPSSFSPSSGSRGGLSPGSQPGGFGTSGRLGLRGSPQQRLGSPHPQSFLPARQQSQHTTMMAAWWHGHWQPCPARLSGCAFMDGLLSVRSAWAPRAHQRLAIPALTGGRDSPPHLHTQDPRYRGSG